MQPANDNHHDLLLGVPAIATHLGLTVRQARHLIYDRQSLPTFKLGGSVAARKTTLAKHFERLERAA